MNWESIQKLQLFQELITCGRNIYSWTYNSSLELLQSNCPNEAVLNLIFALEYKKDKLFSFFQTEINPVIINNPIGLAWIADCERDEKGNIIYIHTIGPVFFNDISTQTLEAALKKHNLTISAKREFLENLKLLPVVSYTQFVEYGQMLHYCITDEKIPYSNIRFYSSSEEVILKKKSFSEVTQHGTWAMEQAILKMIETGNLDYRRQQDKIALIGNVGKLSNGDSMRQFKNQIIAFIVLASRAAVRGGLSPETAYTLSDIYIQNVESSTSLKEIADVSKSMQEDFVQRVHDCKILTGISSQVQKCCDYIQLHIAEKIDLEELSSQIGYSQNYLCKKFKSELGMNIRDYINTVKIEHSKDLLISTTQSIHEISEVLHFSTPSYFCELFRKSTGLTPNDYRKKSGIMD